MMSADNAALSRGKTILIVGASRGLGFELAQEWAAMGRTVFGLVRRVDDRLAAASSAKPNLHWIHGDIRDENSLELAAQELRAYGVIDLLVHNAAIHLEHDKKDLPRASLTAVQESLLVNAAAPVAVVKAFLPLLRRPSRVVLISSEAGSIRLSRRVSEFGYCMSKAALNMFAKLLRNSVSEEGIDVFAVHPGWFSSEMGGQEAPVSPAYQAKLLKELIERLPKNGPLFVDWSGSELPF